MTMKYVLLIYSDEDLRADLSPEQLGQVMEQYNGYSKWLEEQALFRAGDALDLTDRATSVQVRDGRTVTTDGPFAETKEQLGGYYVIDAENLDRAIEAAARCPGAQTGTIEIRPLIEM